MHKTIKFLPACLVFLLSTFFLSACGLFDKDNTPEPTGLTEFRPEFTPRLLWSTNAGTGVADEYLKFSPAISSNAIFTSSTSGTVTSINKVNGYKNWQVNTHTTITAGPGIGDDIVVISNRKGDVLALQQADGRLLWKINVAGEVLAAPAISNGIVVIKAVDGYVRALSTRDGHELWSFQQVEPTLILRGASTPLIRDRHVIVGFANGNLAKLSLHDGQLLWLQPVAVPEGGFAIQRMIDINANPVMFEHRIFAATYQGKISSVDWATGRIIWSHDISSYTGMIADNNAVYISDARSLVWAFNADNGEVNWRQTRLTARIVSGPGIMGPYLVVGDGQGYVHWLSKSDGHFAARVKVGSPVYAAPVVENNTAYVVTSNGKIFAYTFGA